MRVDTFFDFLTFEYMYWYMYHSYNPTNTMNRHIPVELETFARQALAKYDKSHDFDHGVRVYANARSIVHKMGVNGSNPTNGCKHVFDSLEFRVIMYACILHDVLDHKYKGVSDFGEQELREFLNNALGESGASTCLHIIRNISWSGERAGRNVPLERRDILRLIVQCADWMDAIGEIGIQRCIEFSEQRGGELPYAVLDHMHEKLLQIHDKLPIPEARELAYPHHVYMEKWLERVELELSARGDERV